jgi:predicted nucleotidyltransferase
MADDIARATAFAASIGAEYPSVALVYLVGSRLDGTAHPDADFDFIIVGDFSTDHRLELFDVQWMPEDDVDELFGHLVDHRLDVFVADEHAIGAVSLALFTQDAKLIWSRHAPRTETVPPVNEKRLGH